MVIDMGDISTDHNPTTVPTATGTAVSEGTHHTPHPATAAAHAALWLMDSPITFHAMTHPTSIVTPHPTLTTSPADVTHVTILQTRASLIPATPTACTGNTAMKSQAMPKTFKPQINPSLPKLSSSSIPPSDSSSDTDSYSDHLNY